MPPTLSVYLIPIVMLATSNLFMTFAWYGHLRFKSAPLVVITLASWLIAFVLPGGAGKPLGQCGVDHRRAQDHSGVITLLIFAGFSVLYLKEPLGWNHALGFAMIAGGAFLVFQKW